MEQESSPDKRFIWFQLETIIAPWQPPHKQATYCFYCLLAQSHFGTALAYTRVNAGLATTEEPY